MILQEGLERYSWETQDPSVAQALSEALGLPLFFSPLRQGFSA